MVKDNSKQTKLNVKPKIIFSQKRERRGNKYYLVGRQNNKIISYTKLNKNTSEEKRRLFKQNKSYDPNKKRVVFSNVIEVSSDKLIRGYQNKRLYQFTCKLELIKPIFGKKYIIGRSRSAYDEDSLGRRALRDQARDNAYMNYSFIKTKNYDEPIKDLEANVKNESYGVVYYESK